MSYQLRVMPRAQVQLCNAALWWAENRSAKQAAAWPEGFEAALSKLAIDPQRWPLATESVDVGIEIRQMNYGIGRSKTHRAVFEICDRDVVVHAIRHLAQDALHADDF